MGLGATVRNWFSSYLSNRDQIVKIGNSVSKSCCVQQGVPLLASTLFNLYLEPLCEIFRNSGILFHLYADDTQIYFKVLSPDDVALLALTLTKIHTWLASNYLKPNLSKTEFLLISPTKANIPVQEWLASLPALGGCPSTVQCAKSLGFTLDSCLNLQSHVATMAKRVCHQLRQLRGVRQLIPEHDMKTVSQLLVLLRLD